jgi:hypothetical protein
MTKRHTTCHYSAILNAHCPSMKKGDEIPMGFLSQASANHSISKFVVSILIRVIPWEFWGSKANRAVVFKGMLSVLMVGRSEISCEYAQV